MKKKDLLETAIDVLNENKAIDIVTLDIHKLTDIASNMIICSGTSTRHIKSLSDNLVIVAKQLGFLPLGVAGEDTCEWVLVDLGDLIVHIMLPETRSFYSLEKLWDIGAVKAKRAAVKAKAKPKTKAKTKIGTKGAKGHKGKNRAQVKPKSKVITRGRKAVTHSKKRNNREN